MSHLSPLTPEESAVIVATAEYAVCQSCDRIVPLPLVSWAPNGLPFCPDCEAANV